MYHLEFRDLVNCAHQEWFNIKLPGYDDGQWPTYGHVLEEKLSMSAWAAAKQALVKGKKSYYVGIN
jgi:hypothetical protein